MKKAPDIETTFSKQIGAIAKNLRGKERLLFSAARLLRIHLSTTCKSPPRGVCVTRD